MVYELYSVKDVVTGNFSDVTPFVNRDSAIRWFRGLCSESKIYTDLQLFKLGSYNIETGVIESDVDFVMGGVDSE